MEGRSRIDVFISQSMIVGIDEVSLRKLLSNLPVIRGREGKIYFPHLRGVSPLIPIR